MLKNNFPEKPFAMHRISLAGMEALSMVYDVQLMPSNFTSPAPAVPHHILPLPAITSDIIGLGVPVFNTVKVSLEI
jgi:hypothetical protein